jgi:hypothetical protein
MLAIKKNEWQYGPASRHIISPYGCTVRCNLSTANPSRCAMATAAA